LKWAAAEEAKAAKLIGADVAALRDQAPAAMQHFGFSRDELAAAYNGQPLFLHDARIQNVLAYAFRQLNAQNNIRNAQKAPPN
jgi:hypothetical protein